MLKSGEKRSNVAWQMTYGNEEKYIMIKNVVKWSKFISMYKNNNSELKWGTPTKKLYLGKGTLDNWNA